MNQNYTRYTFSNSVKKAQEKFGSRAAYQKVELQGADQFILTAREISFINGRDGFYMATVGENGWPYVQFRGGAKGFIRVLNHETLGIADFRGNMQYITTGNINATGKAALILLDYPTRRRLKIWTETEVLDPARHVNLLEKLTVEGYDAVIERLFVFHIKAFDWNCPQHITPRYTLEEIKTDLLPNNLDIIKDCRPQHLKSDSHPNNSNEPK